MAASVVDLLDGEKSGGFPEQIKVHISEFTPDATYPTGGYTIAPADYEMASIVAVIAIPGVPADATHFAVPSWNRSTGKLQLWKTGSAVSSSASTGALNELAASDTAVTTTTKYTLIVFGLPN